MMATQLTQDQEIKNRRIADYNRFVRLAKDKVGELERLDADILNLSGNALMARLTGNRALAFAYQDFVRDSIQAREILASIIADGGAPTAQHFQSAGKMLNPNLSIKAQLNALENVSQSVQESIQRDIGRVPGSTLPPAPPPFNWDAVDDERPATPMAAQTAGGNRGQMLTAPSGRTGFNVGYNLKELVNRPIAPQTAGDLSTQVEPIIYRDPAISSLSDWTTFQDIIDADKPVGGPPVSSPPMFTPTGPPPDPSWGRGSRNWDQPSFPPVPQVPPLTGIPAGPLPPAGISGPRFNAQDQSAFFDQNPVPPLAPSQSQLLVDQLRQPVNTATETLTQPAGVQMPTPPASPSLFTPTGGLPAVRHEQPGERALIRSVQDAQEQINAGFSGNRAAWVDRKLGELLEPPNVAQAVTQPNVTPAVTPPLASADVTGAMPGMYGPMAGAGGGGSALEADAGAGSVAEGPFLTSPDGSAAEATTEVATPAVATPAATTPKGPWDAIAKLYEPPPLSHTLWPAGIMAGTNLLGAWLGSRAAGKASELQDRRFQEQMAMLREDRARQRAVEDWEIQVAHEREKQIGGPLKQAQAAAIPGYAKHFGLDLDPEKFVTPDLDPRFTGETRPLTASEMAPPGYVLDASGNPVLPSNQQQGGGILSKLWKYGLPAAAIAMPALGAAGVPGFKWASSLAGKLFGLGGGGAAPAVTGASGGMFGPMAHYAAGSGAASKLAMLTKAARTATAVNNLRNALGQNAVGYDASNALGYAPRQNPFQNVQFGPTAALEPLSNRYFQKSYSPFQT
jgi:hypothetical protein